ncbi:ComEC/Rec2 family competence protein [Candidatus Saccharibacteria bacterium]|nr:ComEC/Rec2 family competence protein [Candidatus Saccharibacteria bacterium]
MLKFHFKEKLHSIIHQSWCVVWGSAGVVIGVVVGEIWQINFMDAWWVLVAGLILMLISYLKPMRVGMAFALMSGVMVGMHRVSVSLVISAEEGSSVNEWAWVINLRDFFAERIRMVVLGPEVNLGLSYLLGMKMGLDAELSNNLRTVGLTHIVVASGAHLSILVEVARGIFGRLSRMSGLIFSGLFILIFMAMVGFTPSILRAGLMTGLTLIAWYSGRKIAPVRLILMVAAVTLMIDPEFISNLGWQLSFASYAGIMLIGPGLTKFFYGKRRPGFIASTVLTTLAATMMTLPITLYYFGQMSLINVVANLLILPTLPYAMGLMFLSGLVAGVPGVETVVGFVTTRLLDYHIGVVGYFGGMPQFLIEIEKYQWWVFLLYLPLGILFIVKYIKRRRHVS